jgi:cysteine desulfuration protein SufE
MDQPAEILPPRLAEIVEAFAWAEGPEKLQLLLDFANRLPELPEWLRDHREKMEPVPECMTPVFLYAEETADGRLNLYVDVARESPTVRGFGSVLQEGLSGSTPEEISSMPADFYETMGLTEVLTPQRLNGLHAMLAHVKRLARQHGAASG